MPSYAKTFICLANSRKISGRCIAGKEITPNGVGAWIRPISTRATAELSEDERRFADGTDSKLMDVVSATMLRAEPHGFQTENHVIDDQHHWAMNRRATGGEVRAAIDADSHLWTEDSSSNGLNDRASVLACAGIRDSLRLIEVFDLQISVGVEGGVFGPAKRKVRGSFSYFGRSYLLAVTDPVVERQYFLQQNGDYNVGRAILCISLAEPFNGYAYKLIAGVIPNPAF